MKYTFSYKDGRNYDDGILEGLRFEAEKRNNGEIIVKIFSSKSCKVEIELSEKEASTFGHLLLAAVNTDMKISAQ